MSEIAEEIAERGYAHPGVLVSTAWVEQHQNDEKVRLIESNEDSLLYRSGHIPGAVEVDWVRDLNHPIRRDYLERERFEELNSALGITTDTQVVFYGDRNNWWACYAFWVYQLFGHQSAAVMDGGRVKWQLEGRKLEKQVPSYSSTQASKEYRASSRNDAKIRIFRDQVLEHQKRGLPLVDVRSPEEFSGERMHMPEYPNEGALRGGHIPGAKNIPWARAVNTADGTFKSADELRSIYETVAKLKPSDEIVAYCRIGERSSHTWFVLTHLLGYDNVRNYDGSWTEWGNLVGVPIER